jgi:hypothetical protein
MERSGRRCSHDMVLAHRSADSHIAAVNGLCRFPADDDNEPLRSPPASIDLVAYGDLDGDGAEEAVVVLNYATGEPQTRCIARLNLRFLRSDSVAPIHVNPKYSHGRSNNRRPRHQSQQPKNLKPAKHSNKQQQLIQVRPIPQQ